MLCTISVILLLIWLICVVVVGVTGLAIHLLLVAAAVVLAARFLGVKKG